MNPLRTLTQLALPALAVLATACLSDMSAVTITGFETITLDGGVCKPSGTTLIQGGLDTAGGQSYMVAVSLKNEMPSNKDDKANRLDSNTVYFDTAEVSFRTSAGAPFGAPAPERIPVSVVVPAGGSARAAMTVLSSLNGQTLAGASDGFLIIDVRLTGKTADGAAIMSNSAEFPVQLCTNCMNPCNQGEVVVNACSPGQPDGTVCGAAD